MWLRAGWALALAVVASVSLAAVWQTGQIRVAAGVWLGLAVVFLGSTSLARVASAQARAPLSADGAARLRGLCDPLRHARRAVEVGPPGRRLDRLRGGAGGGKLRDSLHARPRSPMLTVAAAIGLALLLNGAALFVAPNEFKGMFPNMDAYYALPVYLDSRDYFRDTTPSTAQLRNRAVTEDFDRLARQGFSERLATVYFTVGPLERRDDGSHGWCSRWRIPAAGCGQWPGDSFGLAAEEWFTIRLDGDDLIALAEEPFYRRIYRLFGYESLHMIRNGIIRGPRRRLVPVGASAPRGDATAYTFLSGPAVAADGLAGRRGSRRCSACGWSAWRPTTRRSRPSMP